ncbi:hypothetical protein Acel_2030 [Acidothermus cellulolyticus 11B]|uniref:Uncharacterized protein n=1 Tax=Acidothermus cellulolyticus (strain ATCC 43068 / DSM 8971 / 11B) TaxID=351607 RepID=A0LWJ2_ACIC1|nr:hypothetical protein [Acidothermus cellulolyticus]ABK53802.1 hypothetical protein Acel_2030 [Acidothermus cellulolyticus 11B]
MTFFSTDLRGEPATGVTDRLGAVDPDALRFRITLLDAAARVTVRRNVTLRGLLARLRRGLGTTSSSRHEPLLLPPSDVRGSVSDCHDGHAVDDFDGCSAYRSREGRVLVDAAYRAVLRRPQPLPSALREFVGCQRNEPRRMI